MMTGRDIPSVAQRGNVFDTLECDDDDPAAHNHAVSDRMEGRGRRVSACLPGGRRGGSNR